MKINVTVFERLTLLDMIHSRGYNAYEMFIADDVMKKIKFGDEESEHLQLSFMNNRATWLKENEKDVEIDFNESQYRLIQDGMQEMSNKKSLKIEHKDLYKKFEKAFEG